MSQENMNGNVPTEQKGQPKSEPSLPSDLLMEPPKKSGKGLVIGVAAVIIVAVAGVILSSQTELLKGTIEVSQDTAKQEYLQKLQTAKTAADEQAAESEYVKKVVDILEK